MLQTHREVVRQFSKHCDSGVQRLAPSSAQVMNALQAESELDAHSISPLPSNICATQKQLGQTMCWCRDTINIKVKEHVEDGPDIRLRVPIIGRRVYQLVSKGVQIMIGATPVSAGTVMKLATSRFAT